jgi:hypothetical protein
VKALLNPGRGVKILGQLEEVLLHVQQRLHAASLKVHKQLVLEIYDILVQIRIRIESFLQ